MRQSPFGYFAVVVVLFASAANPSPCCAKPPAAVVYPAKPTAQESLAAREIRRYAYVRTGELLPLVEADAPPAEVDSIAVAGKDRPIVAKLATEPALKRRIAELGPQQYVLASVSDGDRRIVLTVGGDGQGTLYGAYRLAEHLGVRFFLHGDVVPDKQVPFKLPAADETGKPLFTLRGVNPWGSHPFGFDQWSADDYKTHIGQLAKMRMNFIGMHCYPFEPTVWLGLDGEFDDEGRVKASYPSHYYNTLWRSPWGPMMPKPTGEYSFGGRMLFERNDWGPNVMLGHCPAPTTAKACNEVFDRTGRQFRDAFTFARLVGVKTCIGTETPMTMPAALKERLKSQGKDPADPAVVREVYEGIFRRIARTHPLDYYWIWTPEGWSGNPPEQLRPTVADIELAMAALQNVGSPFKLAACGWGLGLKGNRAAFDRMVPTEIPMGALNYRMGHDPINPGFGGIRDRDRWAIPWLEGDDFLANPQLWVARTRKDAADALAYGFTGLMGLQWRTRVLGPNVAALAQAGWDQSPWNSSPGILLPNTPPESTSPAGAAPVVTYGRGVPRALPVDDFYADWAVTLFGSEVAAEVASVFSRLDGRVPHSIVRACPTGVIRPISQSWQEVAKHYAFVDELAALRTKVWGAGNRQRFDYWLGKFRYLRAQAQVQCDLGKFAAPMKKIGAEQDVARRKVAAVELGLPAYREVLQQYGRMYGHLLSTVSTYGGFGEVINLEHSAGFWSPAIAGPGKQLAAALGGPLPEDAQPPKEYTGPTRLIVPTVRTSVARGEQLKLKAVVLSSARPEAVTLHWRELGRGEFRQVPFTHVARCVYTVSFRPTADMEYYVEAALPGESPSRFPTTAPDLNQTLVLLQ